MRRGPAPHRDTLTSEPELLFPRAQDAGTTFPNQQPRPPKPVSPLHKDRSCGLLAGTPTRCFWRGVGVCHLSCAFTRRSGPGPPGRAIFLGGRRGASRSRPGQRQLERIPRLGKARVEARAGGQGWLGGGGWAPVGPVLASPSPALTLPTPSPITSVPRAQLILGSEARPGQPSPLRRPCGSSPPPAGPERPGGALRGKRQSGCVQAAVRHSLPRGRMGSAAGRTTREAEGTAPRRRAGSGRLTP